MSQTDASTLRDVIFKCSQYKYLQFESNISIRTYKCNGLGVIDKFRRILIKIRNETGPRSGGIVLLQETRIKNEKIIETYWKGGYVSRCIGTNGAGVMILFGGGFVNR